MGATKIIKKAQTASTISHVNEKNDKSAIWGKSVHLQKIVLDEN
jgi:hypothetical protein